MIHYPKINRTQEYYYVSPKIIEEHPIDLGIILKCLMWGSKTNTKFTVTPIHPDHFCLNNTTCTKKALFRGSTLTKIGLQWLQFINITNQNDVGAPWLLMHSMQRLLIVLIVFRITVWSKACHSLDEGICQLLDCCNKVITTVDPSFRSGDSAGHSILTTLFWIRAFWTSRTRCAGALSSINRKLGFCLVAKGTTMGVAMLSR